MSDYLRNLDKERERATESNVKYQESIRNRGSGRSGSFDKKKNARMCIGFIIFLIIAIAIVVAVNL